VLILRVFYYLIKCAACHRPPGPLLFNKLELTWHKRCKKNSKGTRKLNAFEMPVFWNILGVTLHDRSGNVNIEGIGYRRRYHWSSTNMYYGQVSRMQTVAVADGPVPYCPVLSVNVQFVNIQSRNVRSYKSTRRCQFLRYSPLRIRRSVSSLQWPVLQFQRPQLS